MSRGRNYIVRVGGMVKDDVLATGGQFVLCTEQGNTTYKPLAPPIGAIVTVRVQYKCGRCKRAGREPAAQVEDYDVPEQGRVLLFRGRVFERNDDDGRPVLVGRTHHAFVLPDYGREPACACPEHGGLAITAEKVRRDVARSIELQTGARIRRSERERVTQVVRLAPLREHWTP